MIASVLCNLAKFKRQYNFANFPHSRFPMQSTMLSEREVRNIQTTIIGHLRDLRKQHQSWSAYRDSFAIKLQDWDSYSSEDAALFEMAGDKTFPKKQDDLITEASESRESIMARGRKVIAVCSELLKDEERLVESISAILGTDRGVTMRYRYTS